MRCLDHGPHDVILGPPAGNLPRSTDNLFAPRIDDPEVPPSGIFHTGGPLLHCSIAFGVGSVPGIFKCTGNEQFFGGSLALAGSVKMAPVSLQPCHPLIRKSWQFGSLHAERQESD